MPEYYLKTKKIAKEVGFGKFERFAKGKKTPFLILDPQRVKHNFLQLQKALPFAQIFYALKANPHPAVVSTLLKQKCSFDIASRYELDQLLAFKVKPDRISFGNTIKKIEDIQYFYKKGIRMFATDSHSDMLKLVKYAPGSRVFFRLLVDGEGADWPLSRKFGAHPDIIRELAHHAKKEGLVPYGLSFHVGSQQHDVEQWDQAIAQCKYLFERLEKEGVKLEMLNLGGGLPSHYLSQSPSLEYYGKKISASLKFHFGKNLPRIIIEPGRYMVGTAGVIVSEVMLIATKSKSMGCEWMYLDAGVWNGLDECAGEAIKYPIMTKLDSRKMKEFILAGPTCDSHDILYEHFRYELPANIKEGDKLYFLSTGAYTWQVSSVGFNGFPPLKVYVMK
ncbi:type III PLP-dependent enzyme [Candidatus Woesearchaeota archaeon]|nr:type III PLP-dependent enzyme [Candidatus Woesearchaeota archaeon]